MFSSYYDRGALAFDLLLLVVPSAIALARGFRPASTWIEQWESGHGMRLSAAGRAIAGPHLQFTKRARTIGFVVGWSIPRLWSIALHDGREHVPRVASYAWLILYVVAAVAAEAWMGRARSQRAGVASLDVRRLTDYLPAAVVAVEVAVPVVGGVLAVAYGVLPWRATGFGPTTSGFVAQALSLLPAAALALVLQIGIVRRPQRVATEELRAVDDALRSNAIHMVGFALLFAASLIGGQLLLDLGSRVDTQVVRSVASPLGAIVPLAGSLVFLAYANPLAGYFVKRRSYSASRTA